MLVLSQPEKLQTLSWLSVKVAGADLVKQKSFWQCEREVVPAVWVRAHMTLGSRTFPMERSISRVFLDDRHLPQFNLSNSIISRSIDAANIFLQWIRISTFTPFHLILVLVSTCGLEQQKQKSLCVVFGPELYNTVHSVLLNRWEIFKKFRKHKDYGGKTWISILCLMKFRLIPFLWTFWKMQ